MNSRAESAIGIAPALLARFTAMVEQRISVALVSLAALADHRWYLARGADTSR